MVFDQKNFPIVHFYNFVITNLGLDPDRTRIQQRPGTRSVTGFSKISGSGSGLSENGSETLVGSRERERNRYDNKYGIGFIQSYKREEEPCLWRKLREKVHISEVQCCCVLCFYRTKFSTLSYGNVFGGHLIRVRGVGAGLVMVSRLPGLDTGTKAPSRPAKPGQLKGQCQENHVDLSEFVTETNWVPSRPAWLNYQRVPKFHWDKLIARQVFKLKSWGQIGGPTDIQGTYWKVPSKVRQWTLTWDTFLHKNLNGATQIHSKDLRPFFLFLTKWMEAFILP